MRDGKEQFWACDRPRDYPTRTAKGTCRLHFPAFDDGQYVIFYGRFTAARPQAIAMYTADCEPHATNWGGTALFDVVDGNFKFVRYFPGARYFGCAIPPAPDGEMQTPYCLSSFSNMGQLSQGFGPVKYGLDGKVQSDHWLSAGNIDGVRGAMVFCDANTLQLHHLRNVRWDAAESKIVVEAASVDPGSYAAACDRFQRGEFDAAEKELRESSIVAKGGAFLRDGESKYVKVFVYFKPPNKTPDVDATLEPVPLQH